MLIDIKSMVAARKQAIKDWVAQDPARNKRKLLILQVGNREDSNRYIRGKIKDCAEVGFEADLVQFEEGIGTDIVFDTIMKRRGNYHGIILQEPANMIEKIHPEYGFIHKKMLIHTAILSSQDVDGFRIDSKFKPCTPLGIINIIKTLTKEVNGNDNLRRVTIAVVGQGKLVGQPLVPMLLEQKATVISCNSSTNLKKVLPLADIVVTAAGVRNLITRDMLRDGTTVVIDAGINFDENGKICGDRSKELYDDPNVYVTPVPGGVGLMTRVTLLENLRAAGYGNFEQTQRAL